MCVRDADDRCVLQFTLRNAAGCALHRRASRVIHRSELCVASTGRRGLLLRPAGSGRQRRRQRGPRKRSGLRSGWVLTTRFRATGPVPARARTRASDGAESSGRSALARRRTALRAQSRGGVARGRARSNGTRRRGLDVRRALAARTVRRLRARTAPREAPRPRFCVRERGDPPEPDASRGTRETPIPATGALQRNDRAQLRRPYVRSRDLFSTSSARSTLPTECSSTARGHTAPQSTRVCVRRARLVRATVWVHAPPIPRIKPRAASPAYQATGGFCLCVFGFGFIHGGASDGPR